MRQCVSDMRLHLDQRPFVDQGTDRHAFLGSRSDPKSGDRPHQPINEILIDAVLHIDAVGADACLPRIAEFGEDGPRDRRIDIGIVKHDEGRITAQFQAQFLDGGRRLGIEQRPYMRRSREADLPDEWMFGQRATNLRRIARHDIQDSRRKPRLLAQPRQGQSCEGRLRGGLEDNATARRQRRRDLASDHRRREVPWRDRRDDTDRLPHDQDTLVRYVRRHDLPIASPPFLSEPAQERSGITDLAQRLGARLALLSNQNVGQFRAIGVDKVVEPTQYIRPRLRRPGRPVPHGALRRHDGLSGLRPPHHRDAPDNLRRGRVVHVHP